MPMHPGALGRWGVEERELETRLQKATQDITETLKALWSDMVDPRALDPGYIEERAVIPGLLLQYVGGYANGPSH